LSDNTRHSLERGLLLSLNYFGDLKKIQRTIVDEDLGSPCHGVWVGDGSADGPETERLTEVH
jgi:hypothetical protein